MKPKKQTFVCRSERNQQSCCVFEDKEKKSSKGQKATGVIELGSWLVEGETG